MTLWSSRSSLTIPSRTPRSGSVRRNGTNWSRNGKSRSGSALQANYKLTTRMLENRPAGNQPSPGNREAVGNILEVKEVKEATDETSRARLKLDDFSTPQLPLLPQPPSLPFLRRGLLDIRLVGVIAVIAAMLSFAPILSAQTPGMPPAPAATAALSHDLSGVWMQYRDGDVPGTPGMNGVNERFRPPLTPWGQAKFDAAKPLSGGKAVAGQEDNSALRCEPSGPPQVLVLPNPWEIVQIPGRVFMFFEEQHIWRTIWADGRPLPKDPDPSWLGYSVGHWEGDTFVVETIGFNDKEWVDLYGNPRTSTTRLTERYRRLN